MDVYELGMRGIRKSLSSLLLVALLSLIQSFVFAFEFSFEIEPFGATRDLEFDENRQRIYRTNDDGWLEVYETASMLLIDRKQIPGSPNKMDLSIDGSTLFVTLNLSGSVALIDPDSIDIIEIIPAAEQLNSVRTWDVQEVSPNRLLVSADATNFGLFSSTGADHYLAQIELGESILVTRIASAQHFGVRPQIISSPDGAYAYVSRGYDQLFKLDLQQSMAPVVAQTSGDPYLGLSHMVVSPSGDRIFSQSGFVIDAADLAITQPISFVGVPAFPSSGNKLYFVASNQGGRIEGYDPFSYVKVSEFNGTCDGFNKSNFSVSSQEDLYFYASTFGLCGLKIIPDNPAGWVYFENTFGGGSEFTTNVSANICRKGGSEGPLSLSVAAIDGTASLGGDYDFQNQVIEFTSGEMGCKPVSATIVSDSEQEEQEFFDLEFSIASGLASPIHQKSRVFIRDISYSDTMLPDLVVDHRIELPDGNYSELIVNDAQQEIYLLDPNTKTVDVYSLPYLDLEKKIPLFGDPKKGVLSSAKDQLYVLLSDQAKVAVIDLFSKRLVNKISLDNTFESGQAGSVAVKADLELVVGGQDLSQGMIIGDVNVQWPGDSSSPVASFPGAGFAEMKTNPLSKNIYALGNLDSTLRLLSGASSHQQITSLTGAFLTNVNNIFVDKSGTNLFLNTGLVLNASTLNPISQIDGYFFTDSNEEGVVLAGRGLTVRAFDSTLTEIASWDHSCLYSSSIKQLPADNGFLALQDDALCARMRHSSGFIHFDRNHIIVSEADGTANIDVCRSGGADGSASVLVSTVELAGGDEPAALEGQHYQGVVGTLVNFAHAEQGCKAVPVSLINGPNANERRQFGAEIHDVTGPAILAKRRSSFGSSLAPNAHPTMLVSIEDDDPDVSLSLSGAIGDWYHGETHTIDLFIQNNSESNSGATVTLTGTYSSDSEIIAGFIVGGECNVDTVLVCTMDSLQPGSHRTVRVTIKGRGIGSRENSFTISVQGDDTIAENNSYLFEYETIPMPSTESLLPSAPDAAMVYDRQALYGVMSEVTVNVIPNARRFGSVSATGFLYSNSIMEYFANTPGIYDFGAIESTNEYILSTPAIPIVPVGAEIGDTFNVSGTLNYNVSGIGGLTFPYTATTEIIEYGYLFTLATGTVPTLLVHAELNSAGVSNGFQQNITLTGRFWYSPGIGLLKEISSLRNNLDGGLVESRTDTLKSYSYADTDADNLKDNIEIMLGSSITNPDSDGDGVTDGDEHNTHHSDPTVADTDGDGLDDGAEIFSFNSDPTNIDTDGDSLNDGFEVNTVGSDPAKLDTDGDGLNDNFEFTTEEVDVLNPDTDEDGATDYVELNYSLTDPNQVDTDGDGLTDGEEVLDYFTNPLEPDSDFDGIEDHAEVFAGTNPNGNNVLPAAPSIQVPAWHPLWGSLLILLLVMIAQGNRTPTKNFS